MEAMTKFAEGHAGGGLTAMANALALGVHTAQTRRAKEDELRDELLTDLFNEQLVAAGYRERPSLGSVPVLIGPEHFYQGEADWDQSKFEANGRIWNRVRVNALKPPPARSLPNSRNAIDAAIRTLITINPDLAKAPGKIRCDAVRAEIGQNYISGNGLSDQNIEKHFVRICGIKRISKAIN